MGEVIKASCFIEKGLRDQDFKNIPAEHQRMYSELRNEDRSLINGLIEQCYALAVSQRDVKKHSA